METVHKERTFKTKKEFLKQYKKKSEFKEFITLYVRNKVAVIGFFIFLAIVVMCLFAPLFADYDAAVKINIKDRLMAPCAAHIFGTDEMGRDLFARIVYGGRNSLLISFCAVGVSVAISLVIGSSAAYFGGKVDFILMRFVDILLCLPEVLLALAIVAAFGVSKFNLTLSIGLAQMPFFSRIVRSAVLGVRNNEYVEAARALGMDTKRIILKHILINCVGFLIVQVTMSIASAILSISTLSFLGVGIKAPEPEWGNILATGRTFMRDYSYMVIVPGLAVFFTILSLNMIGDGLRDALDPRLKQ